MWYSGETCFWKDLVFFGGGYVYWALVIMKWCFGCICLWKAILLWGYILGDFFWRILIFSLYVYPNPCCSIIMFQHLCVFGGIFTCVSSTKRYFISLYWIPSFIVNKFWICPSIFWFSSWMPTNLVSFYRWVGQLRNLNTSRWKFWRHFGNRSLYQPKGIRSLINPNIIMW